MQYILNFSPLKYSENVEPSETPILLKTCSILLTTRQFFNLSFEKFKFKIDSIYTKSNLTTGILLS